MIDRLDRLGEIIGDDLTRQVGAHEQLTVRQEHQAVGREANFPDAADVGAGVCVGDTNPIVGLHQHVRVVSAR